MCVPWLSALKTVLLSVAVTPSVGELKLPSEAAIAVPVPAVPALSMKYSAAAMLLFPVVESSTDAVTVGALFVGLGEACTFDVIGPVVSAFTTRCRHRSVAAA